MASRAIFITIGQAPRTDMVPEMRALVGAGVEVTEVGALDGLKREAIAAHYPADDQHRLVTRLCDGSEVVVAKDWMRERLQGLLDRTDPADYDLAVLLCTGYFGHLRWPGLFVEAQAVVDHGVAALAGDAATLGVLVPLRRQIDEFVYPLRAAKQQLRLDYASPYGEDRLEAAAAALADTDLIVMHCMGYTEAMRQTVARASGRPVLLARRLVAAAVGQLALT